MPCPQEGPGSNKRKKCTFAPGVVKKTRGSAELSATDVSPISFKRKPPFGVAAL